MRLDLPVKGMHCAACVKSIEDAVCEVPGVTGASVNLASERAAIDVGPDTSAQAIDESVRRRGYRLVPRRLLYRVDGITAPEAIAGVEREWLGLRGVVGARINYAAQTASIDALWVEEEELRRIATRAGWALFPIATTESERDFTWLKVAVSLPAAGILMATMHVHELGWVQAVLASIVQFWAGWEYHIGFLRGVRRASADMNTLVSIGTNVAFGASLWALWKGGDVMFDTSATIIGVVLLGRWLERRARRGTRAAVEALVELAPRTAIVVRDGRDVEVPLGDVKQGDVVIVKPGGCVPADGVVVEGASAVDESMLTGESRPIEKKAGDGVIGGTINASGALRVRVAATGEATVLAQIVRTVREAQGSKAPAQRIADVWAGRFVPIVLAIAIATLAAWLAIDPSRAISHLVAVLVVACPCALGLATPVAVVVASGRAARSGILLKDAEMLELPARVDVVVFDKTGTLTVGRPAVTGVEPVVGISREELLEVAASVERLSEHPIARAIVAAAGDGPIATDFKSRPGLGAIAILGGVEVVVGSRAFLELFDIKVEARDGVFVARGGQLMGRLTFADQPREDSAGVVAALRSAGKRVVMLTGDDRTTADAMAKRLGIDDVIADVMPADKAAKIKELQERGLKVAMVGDGVNDAPALAQADVGIAVASGSDVAIESAGIVLVRGGLQKVAAVVDLSRRARSIINQNFAWAFGYNAILIPLAAATRLDPRIAAAAMALSSITVVANSLRLRR